MALSLIFTPEPEEKGYTVTCKELPELITYGETLDEALKNTEDAFNAVIEAYDELGRDLPKGTVRAIEKQLGIDLHNTSKQSTRE